MFSRQSTNNGIEYTDNAIQFTSLITDNDISNGRRCELYDELEQPLDTERNLKWSTYIPSEWINDDLWTIIVQVHAGYGKSPVFAIEVVGGQLIGKVRHDSGTEYFSWPLIKGAWLEFDLTQRWSITNGKCVLTMNESEMINYTGPTYYSDILDGPHFKIGLYVDGRSLVPLRRIFHRV